MGKRSSGDIVARARANNYNFGIRSEQEIAQSQRIYNYTSKTVRDQNGYLDLYEIWRNEFAHNAPSLSKGSSAPSNELLNDFVRFHATASKGKGRIDKAGRITANSCLSFMEGFYAGFQRRTGTIISEEERQPVYTYIKSLLWEEGFVINMKKKKMLFQKGDFDRFNDTFWTTDLDIFVHPRNLAQYPFLLSVYTWTGARIGAFFASKDNPDGGLRYKDIELVIERTPSGEWVVFYQINQIWIKNNRNPNVHFGSTTGQHSKLTYDDTHQLLVMAVADKALYGVNTLHDLRQVKIPAGEQNMILPWNESVKNLPVLRQATMEQGVTEKPWAKSTFEKIFRAVAKRSGYLEAPTVHAIRRAVGKMIDERYTSVQRSQHLTQKDLNVFGNSYVANTSSVDGKSAFLNEPARRDHIDYFQSFERFRENGLPTKLPAHLERAIKYDSQLVAFKNELLALKKDCASSSQQKAAQNKINSYLYMIRQKVLVQYQEDWTQQQRQLKVRMHDRLGLQNASKTDFLDAMSRIFPGRDRLAQVMIARNDVSGDIRWRTMQDLHDLITKDYSTIYLPGEEPENEQCSSSRCALNLSHLPKDQRSTHAHACHRQRVAVNLQRNINDIRYCYLCFTWCTEEDWNEHCRLHVSLISSKRCGSIVCCNTLLRPFFCPLCVGDVNLDWSSRLKSWTRGDKVRKHLDTHIATAKWPITCTHPMCCSQHETHESFSDHLKDDHAISAWVGKSSQQADPPSKYEFVDCKRLKRKLCDDISGNIEIDHTKPDDGPDTPQTIAPRMLVKQSLDNFNILAIERPPLPGHEGMQQDQVTHNERSQAEDDALFSSYLHTDSYETVATQLSRTIQDDDRANGLLCDASVMDTGNDLFSESEWHRMKAMESPSPAKKPRIILRVRPPSEPLKENQAAERKRLKTATKSAKSRISSLKAKPLSCKSAIPKIRLRL